MAATTHTTIILQGITAGIQDIMDIIPITTIIIQPAGIRTMYRVADMVPSITAPFRTGRLTGTAVESPADHRAEKVMRATTTHATVAVLGMLAAQGLHGPLMRTPRLL